MFSGGSRGDGEAVGEGSGGRVDAGGGTAVATEAKTAVSVRFGVGNVNGVGEAAPGKGRAPISPAPRGSVKVAMWGWRRERRGWGRAGQAAGADQPCAECQRDQGHAVWHFGLRSCPGSPWWTVHIRARAASWN